MLPLPLHQLKGLGTGDLYRGLPRVTAQLWAEDRARPEQRVGNLPAAPAIVELCRDWRLFYKGLCDRHLLRSIAGAKDELNDDLEIDHRVQR